MARLTFVFDRAIQRGSKVSVTQRTKLYKDINMKKRVGVAVRGGARSGPGPRAVTAAEEGGGQGPAEEGGGQSPAEEGGGQGLAGLSEPGPRRIPSLPSQV